MDEENKFIPPPSAPLRGMRWARDSKSNLEEKNWKDLDQIKEQNNGNFLRVYGWIVITVSVFFTAVFLLSLGAWFSHYILPERCLWLTEDQLSKIQSVLFSGGMGAVISGVIKRQIDKLERTK